jgi:ribonuclease P/MRP protein subunit POP3
MGQRQAKKGPASKGKRSRKRKKHVLEDTSVGSTDALPPSELAPFVQIGLNSVLRTLESSTRTDKAGLANASPPDSESHHDGKPEVKGQHACTEDEAHLAAVFVLSSSHPPVLHTRLPQLVGLASFARPDVPATRLVQMTKNADERICAALGMHRVSCLGILGGAPGSQVLLDLVRAEVPKVEIPWLGETGTYLPVKVNAIETTQPVAKKQKVEIQGTPQPKLLKEPVRKGTFTERGA